MSTKDSIRVLLEQVASLEKSVMSVVFEATRKLSLLTNCQPFLMFESKGRRFYCGNEDLCRLYADDRLLFRSSDQKLEETGEGAILSTLGQRTVIYPVVERSDTSVDSVASADGSDGDGVDGDGSDGGVVDGASAGHRDEKPTIPIEVATDADSNGKHATSEEEAMEVSLTISEPVKAENVDASRDPPVHDVGTSHDPPRDPPSMDDVQTSRDPPANDASTSIPTMPSPNKTKCHICGKRGFTDKELTLHVRKFHKLGSFRCSECNLPFRSRPILRRHLASIHDIGETKFLCQKCAFCTVRKDNMQEHMRRMHADYPNSFAEVAFHQYDRTFSKSNPKPSKASSSKEISPPVDSFESRGSTENSDLSHQSETSSKELPASPDNKLRKGSFGASDETGSAVTASQSPSRLAPTKQDSSGKRYKCHLCDASYVLGHNLGFHLKSKHDCSWREYVDYRKSIGDPLIVGGIKGRPPKPKLEESGIELRESRKTINKKMLQQFRSNVAKKSDLGEGNRPASPNMQVDVGGFMVNFDQSIKKLICPLCAGPYACYSSLRKHVLKDHEPNNQNQILCRFGNCRAKFKDRRDAASHLRDAHDSARDDKYLKTLPLHLGDFFKARCGADESPVVKNEETEVGGRSAGRRAEAGVDDSDSIADSTANEKNDFGEAAVVEERGRVA